MSDKTTISLNNDADKVLEILNEKGIFNDKVDIGRFGFAYAIKNDLWKSLNDQRVGEGRGTTWNVGTFDKGEMSFLVKELLPDYENVYKAVEMLTNLGLISIGKRIEESHGVFNISDFMK